MFNLSLIEYCILEEVRVLSHSNNGYGGWCIKSKVNIADGLDISRATAFRGLKTLEAKGLLERNEDGLLRCSQEWLTKMTKRELEAFSDGETGSLKMRRGGSQNETGSLKMRPKIYNNNNININNINTPYSPPKGDGGGFDIFYSAYPKKKSKAEAMKSWKKLNPSSELLEEILAALEWQKRTPNWQKEGGQFIPHPSTYLNNRRWEDDPESDKVDYEAMSEEMARKILKSGTDAEKERLMFGNPKLYLRVHG